MAKRLIHYPTQQGLFIFLFFGKNKILRIFIRKQKQHTMACFCQLNNFVSSPVLLSFSGSFGCIICNYKTTTKHSQGLPCESKDRVVMQSEYSDWLLSQWLYILLHSVQVSSSFVVVCGRTLQKAFSKSVEAGGFEDVGRPCMAPVDEDAEESACWLS